MSFYLLEPVASTATWDSTMMFKEATYDCPVNSQHDTGPIERVPRMLHVVLPSPRTKDIVWTWYDECLVTEKVLRLLKSEDVSGYRMKEVVVTRVRRGSLGDSPGLHELVVTGWAGQAARESGITLIERCSGCGRERYGPVNDWSKLIDIDRWDGSDIFTVWPMPRLIFVTQKVRELIEGNRLRGARVTPMTRISRTSTGYTPGTLEKTYGMATAARRKQDLWL